MKYHLHSEQFDGALHAACCRFPHDPFPGEKYSEFILTEANEFAKIKKEKRCQYCESEEFPHGIPWWYAGEEVEFSKT